MKKLGKLTLKEMKPRMLVMNPREASSILGGECVDENGVTWWTQVEFLTMCASCTWSGGNVEGLGYVDGSADEDGFTGSNGDTLLYSQQEFLDMCNSCGWSGGNVAGLGYVDSSAQNNGFTDFYGNTWYTQSDYYNMNSNGVWTGGFVVGSGYVSGDANVVYGSAANNLTLDEINNAATAIGASTDLKTALLEYADKFGSGLGEEGGVYLKVMKGIGKACGVVGAYSSVSEAIDDPTPGNIAQASASVVLLFVKINPLTGVAIAVADITGASDWAFDTVFN